MLTYYGIEIELEDDDKGLTGYMDSFFDFHSLVSCVELTQKGYQKYNNNMKGIVEAILMTSVHNKDYKKFDRFELKCPEWDIYFNETFLGFDRKDVNKSIAFIIARDLEKMKNAGAI